MAQPRLQAEIAPNRNIRLYHVNFSLCGKEQRLIRWNGDDSEKSQYVNLPEHARAIVDGIERVPGVVRCCLHSDRVVVEKRGISRWDDIEPSVITAIKAGSSSIVNEEIEYIPVPIWRPENWGLNRNGSPRPREWGI